MAQHEGRLAMWDECAQSDKTIARREFREDHYPLSVCLCENDAYEELCFECVVTDNHTRCLLRSIASKERQRRRAFIRNNDTTLRIDLIALERYQRDRALTLSFDRATNLAAEAITEGERWPHGLSTSGFTVQEGYMLGDILADTRNPTLDGLHGMRELILTAEDENFLEVSRYREGKAFVPLMVAASYAKQHLETLTTVAAVDIAWAELPTDLASLVAEFAINHTRNHVSTQEIACLDVIGMRSHAGLHDSSHQVAEKMAKDPDFTWVNGRPRWVARRLVFDDCAYDPTAPMMSDFEDYDIYYNKNLFNECNIQPWIAFESSETKDPYDHPRQYMPYSPTQPDYSASMDEDEDSDSMPPLAPETPVKITHTCERVIADVKALYPFTMYDKTSGSDADDEMDEGN